MSGLQAVLDAMRESTRKNERLLFTFRHKWARAVIADPADSSLDHIVLPIRGIQ